MRGSVVWRGEKACLFTTVEAHMTDTVNVSFKLYLKKPFKGGVWKQWMTDGIHEFTATGRQKKASKELICLWISQVWKAIL